MRLKAKINALEEENRRLKLTAAYTGINNGTINIDNSTHITANFNLVMFGGEKFGEIASQMDLIKLRTLMFDDAQNFVPGAIKEIHNNDKFPQFQNIMYDAANNKISCYNGVSWEDKNVPEVAGRLAAKVASPELYQPISENFETAYHRDNFCKGIQTIGEYVQDVKLSEEKQAKICQAMRQK